MSPAFALALFAAGTAGGAINSVAGGGSFFVYPTMLFGGIPPVAANATTAVALWPAGLGSIGPYRRHIPDDRKLLITLSIMSALGGGFGAALLLITSDQTFAKLLPFLMLAAATVFTFGPRFTKSLKSQRGLLFGAIIQFLISTYGGYFGGGMGIMMLATFTLMGMTDLHAMNAVKVILGLLINGVALLAFFGAGKVVLAVVVPTVLGGVFGGWSGAAIARRVAPAQVRKLVLVVAWSLTLYFFSRR